MASLNAHHQSNSYELSTDIQAIEETEMQVNTAPAVPSKQAKSEQPDDITLDKSLDDAVPNRDTQLGVQKIEAVTLAWSKKWLAALLIKYESFRRCVVVVPTQS